MSEPSVRETAKAAASWVIVGNPKATSGEITDAVLAAVAAHDGLADVLRAHGWDGGQTLNLGYYRTQATCICGATYWGGDHEGDPSLDDAFAAHLADVVRAWLRDQT